MFIYIEITITWGRNMLPCTCWRKQSKIYHFICWHICIYIHLHLYVHLYRNYYHLREEHVILCLLKKTIQNKSFHMLRYIHIHMYIYIYICIYICIYLHLYVHFYRNYYHLREEHVILYLSKKTIQNKSIHMLIYIHIYIYI
jgi:hypothetical protein